jgi:hypothetical protein
VFEDDYTASIQGSNGAKAITELCPPNPKEFEIPVIDSVKISQIFHIHILETNYTLNDGSLM